MRFPAKADVVVVGGGTAGCVVAGRLAERGGRSVVLLEAGPDYGPCDPSKWPADLLDHRWFALSHDWGLQNSGLYGRPGMPLERARVIGGSSSHNGCAVVWGCASDYDAWEAAGDATWSGAALRPHFERATKQLGTYTPSREELGPFHAAAMDSAIAAGYTELADFNDMRGGTGISANPVNIRGPIRWNAAFAYLDPARGSPELTIVGDALADRIVVDGGRAVAVEVLMDGERHRIEGGEIVLTAGAFCSPAILLRSGIGPADDLRALGIGVQRDLPGVGRNLQDHAGYVMTYAGTPAMRDALREFVSAGGISRDEGTTLRARSSHSLDAGYDIHIYALGRHEGEFTISPSNMFTRSRGSVRLASADPAASPIIDCGFFTDIDGVDMAITLEGVALAREFASSGPFGRLLGEEIGPLAGVTGEELREAILVEATHDYHPSGTCKMGPASDPLAVVDEEGRVHGVAGLRVADASNFPVLPRANTNLPTAVVAERVVAGMLSS